MVKVTIFVILHVIVSTYIIMVRPFDSAKDNLVEIINECGYTVLISTMFYFNSSDRWSTFSANSVIYFLLGISVLNSAIGIVHMFVEFGKTIHKKCSGKSEKKIKPDNNFQSKLNSHLKI